MNQMGIDYQRSKALNRHQNDMSINKLLSSRPEWVSRAPQVRVFPGSDFGRLARGLKGFSC
jgi:hypothetical protein